MPFDGVIGGIWGVARMRWRSWRERHVGFALSSHLDAAHGHQLHQLERTVDLYASSVFYLKKGKTYLRMAMSVLYVSHKRESLPLHAVAPAPQTRDVVMAKGTVQFDGMVLHLFRRLESPHTALPFTQEWSLWTRLSRLVICRCWCWWRRGR